jgi:hypothetical protein
MTEGSAREATKEAPTRRPKKPLTRTRSGESSDLSSAVTPSADNAALAGRRREVQRARIERHPPET